MLVKGCRRCVFISRLPACDASVGTITWDLCGASSYNAHDVSDVSGNVCAEALGIHREVVLGVGALRAPLVRGIMFANLVEMK